MARNQETVRCPAGQWTQLTNSDVSQLTFQVLDTPVYIVYTAGNVAPTQTNGALYEKGLGEARRAINTLTSLSGANRVWAMPADNSNRNDFAASVYVDHA